MCHRCAWLFEVLTSMAFKFSVFRRFFYLMPSRFFIFVRVVTNMDLHQCQTFLCFNISCNSFLLCDRIKPEVSLQFDPRWRVCQLTKNWPETTQLNLDADRKNGSLIIICVRVCVVCVIKVCLQIWLIMSPSPHHHVVRTRIWQITSLCCTWRGHESVSPSPVEWVLESDWSCSVLRVERTRQKASCLLCAA